MRKGSVQCLSMIKLAEQAVLVSVSLVRYLLLGGPSAMAHVGQGVPGLSLPLKEFLVSPARVQTD